MRTRRRSAALGFMVVALALAMLTVAGRTPRGVGRPIDDPTQVTLDQRSFTCSGGIKGTTTFSGSVGGGLGRHGSVGTVPVTITAPQQVAGGAFAAQQVRRTGTFAWLPCPEPRARWWFVGAGGASVTHDTVLTLTNPRSGAAVVDVDVFGPQGQVESAGLHGITIQPGASHEIDLADQAPAVGNLAVSVRAKRGLVAASAVDRFNLGTVGSRAEEWLPPQSLPGTGVTLGGLPAKPGPISLVVVNPGKVDAVVQVKVIGASGTFLPTGVAPISVGPQSVRTVTIRSVLDGSPMAMRITSPQHVTATVRSVQKSDTAFATGVRLLVGETAFAVPEGSGRLVLSSLRVAGKVRVVGYDARGGQVLDRAVAVPAESSVAVPFDTGVRYLRLVAEESAVVAGFAVADAHGIATGGVVPALRSIKLPQVRPGW